MNVLILTAYPPVLHMHGGGVRMFHNIRLLSQRQRVHLISFVDSDEDRELFGPVAAFCESVAIVRRVPDFRPYWLSLDPFLVREFSTPEMFQAVNVAIRKYAIDLIQCEYLQMAQYRRPHLPSVLTAHEALSENARQAFTKASGEARLRRFYQWMQILRYEVRQTRKFNRVVTMTEQDAAYLRSYSPAADIRALPIGVDPQEFEPLNEQPDRAVEVVFVGNYRHFPNADAAEFLVRRMAPRFPGVRFVIAGGNAPDSLAGVSENVTFPGYIPDTRVLYQRPNTIIAAPLFSGTGQRVKLLEAFAMACPVVTSSVGASGFPVRNDVQALIADDVESFALALDRLIGNVRLRRRLGTSAREMILNEFTWEHIGRGMLAIVEGLR